MLVLPVSAQPDPAPIISFEIPSRTGTAYDLAWTPDGAQLAILSYHTMLEIWDVTSLTATEDVA